MTDPYISKSPNDIIRAQDWNDIQIKARTDIENHTHTGGTAGVKLTGDAIDPAASLRVKALTVSGVASLQDTTVTTLKATGLTATGAASLQDTTVTTLKATGLTATGAASLQDTTVKTLKASGSTSLQDVSTAGDLRLSDRTIFLRSTATSHDPYHAIAFRSSFASQGVDGPVVYGNSGGVLGTFQSGTEKAALTWDASGNVKVSGNVTVGGAASLQGLSVTTLKASGTANLQDVQVSSLSTTGDIRLPDRTIFLRAGSDTNHGISYRSSFGGQKLDGPVVYGCGGGVLGTSQGGNEKAALVWDASGNVTVSGNLAVTGRLSGGNGRAQVGANDMVTVNVNAWTQIKDMKLSMPVKGGPVLVIFRGGSVQASATTQRGAFRILVNSQEVTSSRHEFHNGGWELRDVVLTALVEKVAAGSCEVRVEWLSEAGGTIYMSYYSAQRSIIAVEL